MSAFVMDFGQETEFDPLDDGQHLTNIVSAEKVSGPKGNYLKVRFALVDDETGQNRSAWLNLSLADKALWKVAQIYQDLGLGDEEREYESREEFELDVQNTLIGTPALVTTRQRLYEDEIQVDVVKIERPE